MYCGDIIYNHLDQWVSDYDHMLIFG